MGNHHDEDWAADDVDVSLAARRQSWILPSVATLSLLAGVAGIIAALTFKGRHDAVVSRAGDLASLQAKIDQVKVEQAARATDLAQLRQQIAESQREQVNAERRARRAQCDATDAKLDAEVIVEQVRCLKAVADYHACDAENAKAKADDTMQPLTRLEARSAGKRPARARSGKSCELKGRRSTGSMSIMCGRGRSAVPIIG